LIGIGVSKEKRKMSEWNEPLPEPQTDLIEPPLDVATDIDDPDDEDLEDLDDETDPDNPENLEDEQEILEDDDDELDDEDLPLVDATENRR